MITVDVPLGLVELPLDADPASRREALAALAGRLPPAAGVTEDAVIQSGEMLSEQARGRDVRLLGRYAVDTADGPTVGTVIVVVVPLAPPHTTGRDFADLVIDDLLARTVTEPPASEARRVELPAGPALVKVRTDEDHVVEVLIPAPRWDTLVVLAVTSPTGAALPDVARVGIDMARSVCFGAVDSDPRRRVLAP